MAKQKKHWTQYLPKANGTIKVIGNIQEGRRTKINSLEKQLLILHAEYMLDEFRLIKAASELYKSNEIEAAKQLGVASSPTDDFILNPKRPIINLNIDKLVNAININAKDKTSVIVSAVKGALLKAIREAEIAIENNS